MGPTWEDHKPTIRAYWIDNKTLKEIKRIMKDEHGFEKTEKAYENQFRRWGFKKKAEASHWAAVGSKVQKRDMLKKKSNVKINGKLISEKKLRKEISRYYFPSHEERYGQAPSPRTPDGVSVFTPSSLPNPSSILNGLPWLRFQAELIAIINGDSPFGTISSTVVDSLCVGVPGSILTEASNLLPTATRMCAILPVSIIDIQGPALGEAATSILYYFNTIMYLISNNMLEISEDLFTPLEIALTKGPFLSLLQMRTPTTRVFVQTIFTRAVSLERTSFISVMLDTDLVFDAWKFEPGYPLRLAIEQRDTVLAKRLIEAGANLKGDSGSEALIAAVWAANIELVSFLIKKGVDVNAQATTRFETILEMAVMRGNTQIAQLLISAGADVSTQNSLRPEPILVIAARRSDTHMVRLLLEAGVDVNEPSSRSYNSSPLVAAACYGNLQLVQLLLDHGAQIDDQGSGKESALIIAARRGFLELARVLLDAGATVNTSTPPTCLPSRHRSRNSTALYEAVSFNHTPVVELLLRYKADPNTRGYRSDCNTRGHSKEPPDSIGMTMLFAAVRNNNVQITQLLLQAGAHVNGMSFYNKYYQRHFGRTALLKAVENCNHHLVQLLLSAGAILGFSTLSCLVHPNPITDMMEKVVQAPDGEIIRLLLTADPEIIVEFGSYLLHAAIELRDLKLSQSLIDAGADVNGNPSWYQETALQKAVNTGDVCLTRLLLSSGADVNAPPGENGERTALQSAAEKGSCKLVNILLESGADIHARGCVGHRTALQLAAESGHVQVVEQLLHANATSGIQSGPSRKHSDIDTTPSYWRSHTLPAAAKGGVIDVVKLLLDGGADVDIVLTGTQYGTALQESVNRLDLKLTKLLLSYRANPNIPGPVWVESLGRWATGTPLQMAVEKGNMELIRLLAKAGARADVLSIEHEKRRTPLEAAIAKYDNEEASLMVVQSLLAIGADSNLTGAYSADDRIISPDKFVEETALFAATTRGDVQLVQVLLEAGANVDTQSISEGPDGSTYLISPLQIAVALSDLDMSRILLAAGADVKVDSPFRYEHSLYGSSFEGSLLAMAVLGDNTELFHLLLDAGASTNVPAPSEHGATALQASAMRGHMGPLDALLKRGAEVDETSGGRGTALETAAIEGYAGVVSVLLEAGADPNFQAAADRGTALDAAAEFGRIDIVQMFLNHMKARGISQPDYIILLEAALNTAMELAEDPSNFAIGMIRSEIEDAMQE